MPRANTPRVDNRGVIKHEREIHLYENSSKSEKWKESEENVKKL